MTGAALRGYPRAVLAVLVGWAAGTVTAGMAGLFVGLLLVAVFHGLGLSTDHALTLTGAVVALPAVTGMTVAFGRMLLRNRPGIERADQTVKWIAVIEFLLLIPTVGVAPWLNGGRLVLGPAWSWPIGVVAVGLLARALAIHGPRGP